MLGVDTGLFCLVLIKPLAQHCFREITVPYEKDYLIPTTDLVKIHDDAFLGMLCLPLGTQSALTGSFPPVYNAKKQSPVVSLLRPIICILFAITLR
jgi:hypothetical protein